MVTDKPSNEVIRIEIDSPNATASVHCPYCGTPNSVSYSYKTPNSAPWWNMSNFRRHLTNKHKTELRCKYHKINSSTVGMNNFFLNSYILPQLSSL